MPPFSKGVAFPLPDLEAEAPKVEASALKPLQEETEEEASELLAQNQVLYREGQSCARCEYFVADGKDCQKVQGPINSDGWCVVYEGSESEDELSVE